jgi:hypothetical protein
MKVTDVRAVITHHPRSAETPADLLPSVRRSILAHCRMNYERGMGHEPENDRVGHIDRPDGHRCFSSSNRFSR